MIKILIVLILSQLMINASYLPKNFVKAKTIATRLYYTTHLESFYTETTLKPTVYIYKKKFPYKPMLVLQLGMVKSPYEGSKYVLRGQKIEWEHVVPASWFVTIDDDSLKQAYYEGDDKCVTSGGDEYKGRKCAEKVSKIFNLMESDLYNLVPVIGALNALRVNKPYCIIEGEEREFGENIDVEINKKCIEIQENKRGDVARIMLYMNKKYGIQFPDHNTTKEMLLQWAEDDPEDDWEKEKKDILNKVYGMEFTND